MCRPRLARAARRSSSGGVGPVLGDEYVDHLGQHGRFDHRRRRDQVRLQHGEERGSACPCRPVIPPPGRRRRRQRPAPRSGEPRGSAGHAPRPGRRGNQGEGGGGGGACTAPRRSAVNPTGSGNANTMPGQLLKHRRGLHRQLISQPAHAATPRPAPQRTPSAVTPTRTIDAETRGHPLRRRSTS